MRFHLKSSQLKSNAKKYSNIFNHFNNSFISCDPASNSFLEGFPRMLICLNWILYLSLFNIQIFFLDFVTRKGAQFDSYFYALFD